MLGQLKRENKVRNNNNKENCLIVKEIDVFFLLLGFMNR